MKKFDIVCNDEYFNIIISSIKIGNLVIKYEIIIYLMIKTE